MDEAEVSTPEKLRRVRVGRGVADPLDENEDEWNSLFLILDAVFFNF